MGPAAEGLYEQYNRGPRKGSQAMKVRDMRDRWVGRLLAGLAIAAMVAGCGSDEAEVDEGRAELCQHFEDLDESQVPKVTGTCYEDLNCPCGTHCDLGECVAQCRETSECDDGQVCDSFGRCQSEDQANRPLRRTLDRQGSLFLSENNLSVHPQDRERSIRLGARSERLERVRLEAPEGIEIACGDGEFGQRCEFDGGLEAGRQGERRVRVRATDDADFDEQRYDVRLFGDGLRDTINVNTRLPREPEEESAHRAGVYHGYAWPEGSGFVSRTRLNEFSDSIRDMRVPVTIEVHEDGDARTRTAVMSDGLNLIFPEGEVVTQMERDQGSPWELATPRQIFAEADSRPFISQPVLVYGQSQDVQWEGSTLSITHRMIFEGVLPEARAPYVDWQVTVSRTGDLDEDAVTPSLTEGHAPVDPEDAITDPLPLEEVVSDYFDWELGSESSMFDTRREWVEAALCNEYPAPGEGLSPAVAFGFTGDLYEMLPGNNHPAGELACDSSESPVPPKAFQLLNASVLDVYENMERCFDDWERAALVRETEVMDTGAYECVDEARFIYALTTAQHADRERALGDGSIRDDDGSALAHRLLQQWMSLHSFVAQEYSKVAVFNQVVPAAQAVDLDVNRLDVIDRMTEGFDLLLTPRIAAPMAYMPTSLLRRPDYRSQLFSDADFAPQRTHDQSIGLPVAILQAYGQQLGAIGEFLEDVQYARNDLDEIEGPTKDALARGFLLMAIAQGSYDEMRVGGQPEWENEWQMVRRQVGSRIAGVINQLEDARRGVNPLGIEDVDLPLYRIGDQAGTIQRFSAVSDFLVGVEPGQPSVATDQVQQAQDALSAAQDAWLDNVQRDLEEQVSEDAQDRRLEAIQRDYGGQVNSLCGGTGFGDLAVLENADSIDGNNCYLAPQCTFETEQFSERLSASDVGFDLCMTALYRDRLGSSVTSGREGLDEALDQLADIYGSEDEGVRTAYGSPLPLGGQEITVFGRDDQELLTFDFSRDGFRRALNRIPEEVSDEMSLEIQQQCEGHRQYTQSQRPDAPGDCSTTDECPVGFYCDSGQCEPEEDDELDDPGCYQGALGEAALELRSQSTAVSQARSKLQEYGDRYENAMQSCLIQIEGDQAIADATLAFNISMAALGAVKLASDSAAHIAAAGRQSSSLDAGLTMGATAGFAFAEATAKIMSDTIQFAMDNMERGHESLVDAIERDTAQRRCINDAEMHLIGLQSQQIEIQRATQELAQQLVRFDNLQRAVDGLLSDGQEALANEVERTRAPVDIDFWIDERINEFDRYMRAARRATYLSVMAVEYEYQFSSAERQAALAAQTPADLEQVLSNLRAFTMTGSIGGSNPGELLAVVSLRDQILQIRDDEPLPAGFYDLSASEQFQALLNSPNYAVYEDGDYQGQEIPFRLAPLGRQELGEYQGISLLAGTDCAERLWSANMSLVGEDINQGGDSSFSRVVLRKRNTFFSQWCDESAHDDVFQMASTRPSRNLFLDPYARDESTTPVTSGLGSSDETEAFSNSRISAYFNISRGELEAEAYTQGSTRELAGRGLYGDYAIFFPAETLSDGGSSGLDLEALDDILMRFDYVSVSQ